MAYAYGQTWDDLERTPRATSWRMLRALRQAPPGFASQDESRKRLFTSSLEQCEQFFRAAETVGPETRALLLFYGLAQSGRALRAASQADSLWNRDGGHGLTVSVPASGLVAESVVKDAGRRRVGHFGYVATTLGRASLPTGQTVADLSRLLRVDSQFPMPGSDPYHPPLTLDLVNAADAGGPLRASLIVPASTWEVEMPPVGERVTADYDRFRAHVRTLLEEYPTLAGAALFEPAPGHFTLFAQSLTQRTLALFWPDLQHPGPYEGSALHGFSDDNGQSVTIYPRGAGSKLAVHPYLLWWEILFAMAHFIRYEPSAWAAAVDVDHSSEAVAIEHIGEQALVVLPELIHRALVRGEPQH